MHLSLRELFGLIAFCSVFAWYGRQFDFDYRFILTATPMFFCCLAFVMLTRDTFWIVSGLAVPLLLCLLSLFLSVTMVATVLLLTAAAMYRADRPRQSIRYRIVLAMCCAAAAMVVGGLNAGHVGVGVLFGAMDS